MRISYRIQTIKKNVIKDIWTSLGGKLRTDPRVQKIMNNTDQIIKTRFPSRLDTVRNRISENQTKSQTNTPQGKNSSISSNSKGSKGYHGR